MGNTNNTAQKCFMGLGEFTNECNLKEVANCNSLKRIKCILEKYNSIQDNDEFGIQLSILQYMENNNYDFLINDYHHILTKHFNYKNNDINKINYKIINNAMRFDIDCDINNCKTYQRNQRKKQKKRAREEKVELHYDFKGLFLMNLLDNIHTYFIHGYDIGFRVNFNTLPLHNYSDKDYDHIFSHDTEIVYLESALVKKRDQLIKFRGKKNIYNNRYQTHPIRFKDINILLQSQNNNNFDSNMLFDILFHNLNVPDNISVNNLSKTECINLHLYLKANGYDSDSIVEDMLFINNKTQSNLYWYLTDSKIGFLWHRIMIKVLNYSNINKIRKKKILDEKKRLKRNVNNYGQRFYYWLWLKNNTSNDNVFNPGYKYCDWYINQKYSTLKIEILHFLSINEFNVTKNKAIRFLHDSFYLKKLQCTKECDSIILSMKYNNLGKCDSYNIKPGELLSYNHLMSILFYTDYPNLCAHFCNTFKRKKYETDESLKNRNSEFHNWSKLLHEIIHLYGNHLYGIKYDYCNGNGNQQWISPNNINQSPKLYHSVSNEYLNMFMSRFCAPTSMSRQIEVCVMYSVKPSDGIIIEIENYNHLNCCPYYFNSSLVSSYSIEDERIFIGGSSVSNRCYNLFDERLLLCKSIKSIKISQNLIWYFRAFSVLDMIITRTDLYKNVNDFLKKYIKKDIFYFKIINGLLMQMEFKQIEKYKIYPKFVVNCLKKIINNIFKITICVHCLKEKYASWIRLFNISRKKNCTQLLLIDKVCDIFIHCKIIEFYPEIVSRIFIDEFIKILNKIDDNDTKWKKLKIIKLLNYRYSQDLDVPATLLFMPHDVYWNWYVKEEKDEWDFQNNEMRYNLTIYRD